MEINDIKIALIGNSGVGKTSIIRRFMDDLFDENISSTICANSIVKTITRGKKNYALNIWDTAGQERYQSLGKHFYKDAYIILLIYDITNQKSFDSLKQTWYPDIQIYGENYVILGVVANKSDLYENDNCVDEQEANNFAKEIGALFFLVSARNGSNISILFDDLLNKFLEKDIQEKVIDIEMGKKSNSSFELDQRKKRKKKCCK